MAYATEENLFNVFGRDNVRKWADVNNNQDGQEVDARIVWAIASAEAELNDRLRMSVYQLPLEGTIPHLLMLATCWLAGLRLYEARGLVDSEESEGFGRRLEKRVMEFVNGVLTRRIVLVVDAADVPIETRVSLPVATFLACEY